MADKQESNIGDLSIKRLKHDEMTPNLAKGQSDDLFRLVHSNERSR